VEGLVRERVETERCRARGGYAAPLVPGWESGRDGEEWQTLTAIYIGPGEGVVMDFCWASATLTEAVNRF
jgi:hypothetical protein